MEGCWDISLAGGEGAGFEVCSGDRPGQGGDVSTWSDTYGGLPWLARVRVGMQRVVYCEGELEGGPWW